MSITAVIQGRADTLYVRHINPLTKAEITVSSGTVTISREGSTAVSGAAVTETGDSLPGYARTWDSSTFPIGRYHAQWTLNDGSTNRIVDQYFEVVLRRFECPIGKSDFEAKYPFLEEQLPTGTTVATYLEAAWDEIELLLYGRLSQLRYRINERETYYPGNVFFTDVFRQAAEYWTVSDIYRAIAREEGSEDDVKAKHYEKRAKDAIEAAMVHMFVDTDDDNVPDDQEAYMFSSGRLIR